MNKKGFTLIELIATIVIMALIFIMVMPSMNALRNINKDKPFTSYADSLIEGARIYVRREKEDINKYGYKKWKGCVYIKESDLLASNLIKKFSYEDYTCQNIVVKYTNDYNLGIGKYDYKMTCLDKSSKVVFQKEFDSTDNCDNNIISQE